MSRLAFFFRKDTVFSMSPLRFRKETVCELLSHMFDGERVDSVIINGLSVIQTLLEFKKTGCVLSRPPCMGVCTLSAYSFIGLLSDVCLRLVMFATKDTWCRLSDCCISIKECVCEGNEQFLIEDF